MSASIWHEQKTRHIHQRIIIEGDLTLQTPAHFGNGDGDELTDMPLLVDPYDNRSPLLTGASLAGALRSYLGETDPSASVRLFGGDKGDENGEQSPLIVADSLGESSGATIRAGVRLDGKTRTAADKALFDVQLWQAGTVFPLRFELLVSQQFRKDKSGKPVPISKQEQTQFERDLKQALATALEGLSKGRITLGARKRRGYGEVKVTAWQVKSYDLTDPCQLCAWLKQGNDPLPDNLKVDDLTKALDVEELLPDNRHYLHLHATFALQGSLLIRSGEGQDDTGPDMVHLHAQQPDGQKKPILSGTSLAGGLRAQATRIANTLDKAGKAKELIYDLFGPDMNDREWMRAKKEKGVRASRLTVKETVVENGRTDLVQNRVSIDRFTGGARDTALFDQQPVFASDKTLVTIDLHLRNPEKHDIGLLLLLLKDLWTEDLPLGGESSVGRGRLQGRRATLNYQNGERQEWVFAAAAPDTPNKLNFEKGSPADLQKFVDALHTQLNGGHA